jgi:hypothetical protein
MTDYNLRQVNENPIIETAFLWDFPNMNMKLTIVDGCFAFTDDYVVLFSTCNRGFGFKQKDSPKWEWKEGETHNLVLQFWQKSREETDYKTKEKKTIEPSDIELYMGWVAQQFEDNHFTGKLNLNTTSSLKMCYAGLNEQGLPLDEKFRDMLSSTMAGFTFIETPDDTVWTDDIKKAVMPKPYVKKPGSYGGSKGQTEAERINDRVEWLKKAAMEVSDLKDTQLTLGNIINDGLDDGADNGCISSRQLEILLKIMG